MRSIRSNLLRARRISQSGVAEAARLRALHIFLSVLSGDGLCGVVIITINNELVIFLGLQVGNAPLLEVFFWV